MLKPPIPANEIERLQALHALDVLDTPAEERFDRLTRIAQYVLQVPIVLVSLVDTERQWFKSRQGLEASETARDISFCGHAVLGTEVFVVPDAAADARFADNPLVLDAPHIRFYAGAPLTLGNGLRVGTLCAIDRQPRQVSDEQLAALRDLAQCVSEELERGQKMEQAREMALLQARYSAIIASSDDAIISKTLDGIITTWNPAAERLFGYPARAAIGQPMLMLFPPERVGEEPEILARIGRGERIEHFETVRLRQDGSRVDVSVSLSPIADASGRIVGASKIVRDISARKQTEEAARASSQLVKSILDTVVDGIITIDRQGTVLSCNPAAERLFGYAQAEIVDRNVKCLMPEPYAAEHDGYLARYMQTREARVIGIGREVTGRRKDGSTFPMELAVSEMPQADRTLFVGIVRDITERKAAESRLAELNRRFNLATSAAGIGVWDWDVVNNDLVWDDRMYRVYGVDPEAFGGAYEAWANCVHPDDLARTAAELQAAVRGERPFATEFRLRDTDGRIRYIKASATVVCDAAGRATRMIGVNYDITPVKVAQARLEEALRLQRAILDSANFSIISTDDTGLIRTFNQGAERLLGYTAEEMVERQSPAIIHDADEVVARARVLSQELGREIAPGFEVFVARARLGLVDEHEWTYVHKDGRRFPVLLSVTALRDRDSVVTGFLGIASDITERKQMERMKSEFVSTVSHELRTPLTSIRGALGLVLGKFSGDLPDKARQLLDTASRNSERLTLLINDILDLEKIASGHLDFELKATDLVAVARHALAANEGYGQQHDVALRLVEAPARAMVQADEHRLLQVFANLISNAVKYSPAGGTVDVALVCQGGRLSVSVRDHGPGIPAEFRSRMFQRFAQADSSDTRQKGGTGLGLSITKAIVERHGGSIGFTSEEGVGTEFHFELPEWREIIEQSSGTGDRPTMLICEDNADVAMVLAGLLEQEGVASDRVTTATAALEMLGRKRYRALLLDLGLPDMDGLTLIQRLRSDEATRDLPVIVVTGRTREDIATWDGQAVSVLDWLQKPVDRERLGRALNQALQSQRRPCILHVEDDTDIIQVTQALLEEDADYSYATSLAAARLALVQSHCDLLLLDITLPDGSGLELLDAISPDTKVIVFSGQDPGAALKQHVTAALVKGTTSNDRLLATIKQVIHQERN